VFVPLIEEEGFRLDLDAIRAAISPRTKAIMYCSPNNPTGTVLDERQLRGLAEIAIENHLTVITDEAYEYFIYDGQRHFSIASIPEMAGRVVSCFTVTKTYAMTGWRLGYVHAREDLIRQVAKVHIPLAICAPAVSQYAALAALKGPQTCVDEFGSHYLSARDLMCRRLDRLPSIFAYQKPNGGYLMFPRLLPDEGADSATFCKKLLREARVSTTPGVAFGPTGEGHLRLSFCVPEAEIDKAFDRMEDYFR
jgi:aminotransferase